MVCNDIRKIIDTWQEAGEITNAQIAEMETHFLQCPDCAKKYVLLLPFLKKDAGGMDTLLPEAEITVRSVKAQVMEKIQGINVSGNVREYPVRKYIKYLYAAAALILLLIGAGWLITNQGILKSPDEIVIQFELKASEAESVYLVGDFSSWDQKKIPLTGPDSEGLWTVKIRLKKHRTYNYNFLINGEIWIPDPNADFTLDDGFGGINSIINL